MKNLLKHKTILATLGIVFAVALSIGLSYADYTVNKNGYKAPTQSATDGNTEFPVNIGGDQVKGGIGTQGGLGVKEFVATQNAQFDGKTSIGGMVLGQVGADPSLSDLMIGDANAKVHFTMQGKEYTYLHGLYSDQIKTAAGQVKPVCADEQGNIIICPDAVIPPPAIPPKDIYGSLTEWCDTTGMPRVKFDFYTATPASFNMNLAMCTNTYWYSSKISCWGTDLLGSANPYPWLAPTGNKDSQLSSRAASFNITIPSGVTTWTTPDLQVNGEKAWCRGSGKLMEPVSTGFWRTDLPYPMPPYGVFMLKMLNNTDYNLHLTGKTQYKTTPLYNLFDPIIIK